MVNQAQITIRYDGKDAENHIINLHSLGESLQGAARIISTCANFLLTFEYTKQLDAQNVKVVAQEAEPNCYELVVIIKEAMQTNMFTGFAGASVTAIVSYVIARQSNSKKEMKHVKDLAIKILETSSDSSEQTTEKLLDILEKMATGLLPSSRKAVKPVGESCDFMRIGDETAIPIDVIKKDAILSRDEEEITEERVYQIYLSEVDTENSTAKFRFINDEGRPRINATITDPVLQKKENGYLRALYLQEPISIKAKSAEVDGEIVRLYISDISQVGQAEE